MLLILGCVFCNLQCSMVAAKRYTIQRARTNLCQCQFMKLYRFISRVSCLPLRESQTQSTTLRRQRESESTRTRKISWKSEVIRSGCGLQSNEIPGMTLTPFHAMQKRSLFFFRIFHESESVHMLMHSTENCRRPLNSYIFSFTCEPFVSNSINIARQ